jgi:hypothetical protein
MPPKQPDPQRELNILLQRARRNSRNPLLVKILDWTGNTVQSVIRNWLLFNSNIKEKFHPTESAELNESGVPRNANGALYSNLRLIEVQVRGRVNIQPNKKARPELGRFFRRGIHRSIADGRHYDSD